MAEDLDQHLKDAFATVHKTFSEFALLLQDFEAELKSIDEDFVSEKPGNKIFTDPSFSLKKGHQWLYKYPTRYYVNRKSSNNLWYGAAGMINRDKDDNPIVPLFLMGVIGVNKPKKYKHWWLSALYTSHKQRYDVNGKEIVRDIEVEDWTYIKFKNEDKFWFDMGHVYVKRLSTINSRDDVKDLAEGLRQKFRQCNLNSV